MTKEQLEKGQSILADIQAYEKADENLKDQQAKLTYTNEYDKFDMTWLIPLFRECLNTKLEQLDKDFESL